jgi:hypothetical protein
MSPELFIVWLQGYLSATGDALTVEHIAAIKAQLSVVQLRGPYRTIPTGTTVSRA